ncbi:MAG TPA: S53 family peptidase [Candidatus Sulfotelmatobacter sp.]
MNGTRLFAVAVLLSIALPFAGLAVAQDPTMAPTPPAAPPEPQPSPAGIFRPQGTVVTPPISDPHRRGVHTNYKIFVPAGRSMSSPIPDFTFAETPASMGCVYGVGPKYTGCNPTTGGTRHPVGGWGAIAVVEAYDDPTISSDLKFFDTNFALPKANLQVVYANSSFGTLGGGFSSPLNASCSGVPANGNFLGWDLEESLDAEWAHVMAPSAKIIVVEACTQSLEDLLYAVEVAGMEVGAAGGGVVSNSWGYSEACVADPSCNGGWSGTQVNDDNYFYRDHWAQTTYFASAGDSGAEVLFPSASPWVVSVGGTTVNRDASGNFLNESCWADSGGGSSAVEFWQNPPSILNGMGPWTGYQYQTLGEVSRSTPDISFNADPASGVYVYDTDGTCTGFCTVGGTSVGSPAIAGIVNASNNRLGQAALVTPWYDALENNLLYSQLNTHTAYVVNFYDVTTGSNGNAAGPGYDQCTGIGSPRGKLGK